MKSVLFLSLTVFSLACNASPKYTIGECISSKTSSGTIYIEKVVSINESSESYTVSIYVNGAWESRLRETSFSYAHNSSEYNKALCPN